jgi:hypothetical protein
MNKTTILTALITGIDAVSIALRSETRSHSYKPFASLCNSSIISYLSPILSPVTAISISLYSKARPVIKDPNSLMEGF